MAELWTIEWSGSQRCFHIDELPRTLERNLVAYAEGRSSDYQVIGIARTQDAAHLAVESLKENQEIRRAA